jgi:hypothetical protein
MVCSDGPCRLVRAFAKITKIRPELTLLRRDVSGAQLRLQFRPRSNFELSHASEPTIVKCVASYNDILIYYYEERAFYRRASPINHLIGVSLIGVSLIGVSLIGVSLIGVSPIGASLIDMLLTEAIP